MPAFTDQLHRTITLERPPRRIISLVPSQTELLYALDLEEEVIGITKFCVHPEAWFRSKTRIGGTKDIHPGIIRSLEPDLIIANKEENLREQVEQLYDDYPVWVSDISNLDEALDMIRRIGMLTDRAVKADHLAGEINHRFEALKAHLTYVSTQGISGVPGPFIRAAYLIWRNPYMASGGDTFIHHMLTRCGLVNIFSDKQRYPSIRPEELAEQDCRLVLLSSEPYPFREKHIEEIRSFLPNAVIRLVNGEMFSWYGSRLLESPGYFRQLRDSLDTP